MGTRYLYIAHHGDADAFGNLTDTGREQSRLLGQRLAHLPIRHIWHSPLPRAADSAEQLNIYFTGTAPVRAADELIDNIPYVPKPEETPQSWEPFFDGFDGFDPESAEVGRALAQRLATRFAQGPETDADLHEMLITHAYPIAWLVRHALDAPEERWLGLNSANAALTVIEYRPGLLPSLVLFNDMGHLPPDLQWTGFVPTLRP